MYDTKYIPISDIEFSTPMINKLKEHSYNFSNLIHKDRFESYALARTDSLIDAIKRNEVIPPVHLNLHEIIVKTDIVSLPKYIPPHLRKGNKDNIHTVQNTIHSTKNTYSVINGRNRIVASLLCGMTHISAIIL